MDTAVTRRRFLESSLGTVPLLGFGLTACAGAPAREVVVYKDATCGCCNIWIQHLQAAGYTTEAIDAPNLSAIKAQQGIPREMQSCHTALVGGYVIEGHVVASDIERLLREQPEARGLAVPGMPLGTPGMGLEQGIPVEPHNVYLLAASGPVVYASYGA